MVKILTPLSKRNRREAIGIYGTERYGSIERWIFEFADRLMNDLLAQLSICLVVWLDVIEGLEFLFFMTSNLQKDSYGFIYFKGLFRIE